MAETRFEPMTASQILDRAFRLYREGFLRYVAIVAIVQVPVGLLMVAGSGIFYSNFTSMAATNRPPEGIREMGTMFIGLGALGLGAMLSFVSLVLAMAAMARSMSASYLGDDLPVSQTYRALLPKAGWLFLMIVFLVPALFVMYIAVFAAMMVLILSIAALEAAGLGVAGTAITFTGVMVITLLAVAVVVLLGMLLFSLSVQAIMVEDLNTIDAIGRSARLLRGNVRKSLGVALLGAVLAGIPFMMASGIGVGVSILVFGLGNLMALQVIQQSLSLVMQILVMPVWGAAMLLLYYDLRIRKEGFDLEVLARAFQPAEAATHAGAR